MSRGDARIYVGFVNELNRLKGAQGFSAQEVTWVRDLAFRTRTRNKDFQKMIDDTLTVVVPLAIKERLTS